MTEGLSDRFALLGASLFPTTREDRDDPVPFSHARFRALGETGLFRLPLQARGLADAVEALSGLAEGSLDLGLTTSAIAQMVAAALLARHAPGATADRWLARLASGEAIAAVANAESGAGTHILGLRTLARPTGHGFRLSGKKSCITNLPVADLAIVSARVLGAEARRSITCLAVELPAPRAFTRPRLDLCGLQSSPTGDLVLHRTEVPHTALVGEVGGGVALFKPVFALERLFAGTLSLAVLRRCQRRALDFAETRGSSGEPVGVHQHVQERVLRMRVAADLLESHLRETARRMDAGGEVGPALAAIKIHGLDAAQDAIVSLRRLLGSRGLSRTDWTARVSEDLAALGIFGGTELHKRVLYADLARCSPARWASATPASAPSASESPSIPPGSAAASVAASPPPPSPGRAGGHRLAIALLTTPHAEPLLRENGFRPLHARITYRDRTGERREEQAPCWVVALDGSDLVEAIEAHGELDLGEGTF